MGASLWSLLFILTCVAPRANDVCRLPASWRPPYSSVQHGAAIYQLFKPRKLYSTLEDTDQTGLVPDAAGKLQVRQRESYCDSFKVQETCLAGDSTRRG
ncbi:uncharacterized protein LOC125502041 isoform X2 [Athalia rosae]|uniref:uncharacterized protein LOC125502041 isoform X2 n=1 Tax=Athalia rosae TaxID=37344 RepID=UPI002033DE80|nr:uncharacterized protein LOC125502041 isoform X2 [Athalia rosae]XP_048515498.1 uncharacterized protein LOC125502041 isoform X2 [Athalia rosae]